MSTLLENKKESSCVLFWGMRRVQAISTTVETTTTTTATVKVVSIKNDLQFPCI